MQKIFNSSRLKIVAVAFLLLMAITTLVIALLSSTQPAPLPNQAAATEKSSAIPTIIPITSITANSNTATVASPTSASTTDPLNTTAAPTTSTSSVPNITSAPVATSTSLPDPSTQAPVVISTPTTANNPTPITTSNAPSSTPTALSSNSNNSNNNYQLLAHNSINGGHTAAVNGIAFSPDASEMVSVSADTFIKLWKISSSPAAPVFTPNCTLSNQPYPVTTVAWSPTQRDLLATGDSAGGVKLWQAPCQTATASPFVLVGSGGTVRVVRFSPEGRLLASAGADSTIRLWDVASHQLLTSYDNGHFGINDLVWSPDGAQLAFVSTQGLLKVLAIGSGGNAKLQEVSSRNGSGKALLSVAWSPDGRWLAAGDGSGSFTLWDNHNANKSKYFRVAAFNASLHSLAFSPDSSTIAVGASDNTLRLWQINIGADGLPQIKIGPRMGGHDGPVRSVAFGLQAQWLLSSSDDRSVRLWNPATGALLGTIGENTGSYLTTVNWSAPANQILTAASDGKIRLWQADGLALSATFSDTVGNATRATALSPDGKWLAAVGDSGQLSVWKMAAVGSNQPVLAGRLKAEDGVALAVAFAPDNGHIVTGGINGTLSLWSWDGSKLQLLSRTQNKSRPIRTLAFAPDRTSIISGNDAGKIQVWDSPNLQPLREWQAHFGYVKTIGFDGSGTLLVSAGGDGSVRLWNPTTGLSARGGGVQFQTVVEAIAVSADGGVVAASTADGQVWVWRSQDSRPFLTIKGQDLAALSLVFGSADGTQLAAATQDGAIQVWKLTLTQPDPNIAPLPAPSPVSAQLAQPGSNSDFVSVQNGHLSLHGQPIKLKGFDFYPRLAPWAEMWKHWDGPQVAADLNKADQLGANALRLLIPYGAGYGWTTEDGSVDPTMLNELDQMLGLASQHGMRVVITLYDFYDSFPLSGTPEEAANWRYLNTIVSKYRDDPRVLGWDLHNEPDNYSTWTGSNANKVLDWLERASLQVRLHDPNHFVTVGFGNWTNLRLLGPNGLDALAIEDVVALHAYDPSKLDQLVGETQKASGPVPFFLEEFGWPSAPREVTSAYSEDVQAQYYQAAFDAINRYNLDGLLAWQLWDFTPSSLLNLKPDLFQNYFGLVRLDGTLKAATGVWKGTYPPSNLALPPTSSAISFTLTTRPVDPSLYPQYFPQTGFAVPSPFKEYWNREGGQAALGNPTSGVLQEGGLLVQYFERGRLEYHPESSIAPGYAKLSSEEQLKQLVHVTPQT